MSLDAMRECAVRRVVGALLVCGAVALSSAAYAQDTRTVTEPKIPATCVKLDAKIVAAGDALAEADEKNEDTASIQAVIDGFAAKCKLGMAVELAAGAKGANA